MTVVLFGVLIMLIDACFQVVLIYLFDDQYGGLSCLRVMVLRQSVHVDTKEPALFTMAIL